MKKIDKKLYEHLGSQLKQARLAKGFSLAEVANMVGKSKVSIKRYEDASVRIDMDTLYLLCNVLGVRIKEYEISDGDNVVNRYVLEPIKGGSVPSFLWLYKFLHQIRATEVQQLCPKNPSVQQRCNRKSELYRYLLPLLVPFKKPLK